MGKLSKIKLILIAMGVVFLGCVGIFSLNKMETRRHEFQGESPMKNVNSSRDKFYYPRAINKPKHLYVIDMNRLKDTEGIMAISLQGILAQQNIGSQIYILPGPNSYKKFLTYLEEEEGVTTEIVTNVWEVIEQFRIYIDGYILCNSQSLTSSDGKLKYVDDSLNVATSLAGIKRSIIVDEQLLKEHPERFKKLDMSLDARGKDEAWLMEQPEYESLNKKIIFELEEISAFNTKLRDYAIMSNSMCFYDREGADTPLRQQLLADIEDDSAVMGWGGAREKGEDSFIRPTSKAGKYYIPADHAYNLSVYSAFASDDFKVRQRLEKEGSKSVKGEEGKHYVTFLMSDGDNLQYALNGFEVGGRMYDAFSRGKIDLGWGIPASMIDTAPTALQDLYNRGTDKDYFITYCLGGYMYFSKYPKELWAQHAQRLNEEMSRNDTNLLSVIDFNQFSNKALPMWNELTSQSNVDGIFYIEYSGYKTESEHILWSNDKPIIPVAATYWQGLNGGDKESIAKQINDAPRVLSNPDTYSLIVVHAWSRGVDDVITLANQFDEDVEIVDNGAFLRLIKENIRPYEMP